MLGVCRSVEVQPWCRKIIARLTNLDDANLSRCAVNGGFEFLSKRGSRHENSSYRTSWSSNPVGTRQRADLTAVCWFVAIGLSLTALFCALGQAESIGQALAFSG